MRLILFFIYFLKVLSFNLPIIGNEKNIVTLHLEKFNQKYNLLHIGISFNNNINIIRFDYRPFNNGKSYLTTDKDRLNANLLFPDANVNTEMSTLFNNYRNVLIFDTKNINKKNIFWGITNKTQTDIIEYEKEFLISKPYRVGLYDCRHYVNDFSSWCLNKQTPIWRLNQLWDEN